MADDDSEDNSNSDGTGGLEPETRVKLQTVYQPGLFEAVEQMEGAQEVMAQTTQPVLFGELLAMSNMMDDLVEHDFFYPQVMVAKTLQYPAVKSILHTQKIFEGAIQSGMFDELTKINQSLNTALMSLNSPSIYADVSSISTTEGSSKTQSAEQSFEPKTDVDEIRPPETRIHDKLVWDDGEWYRERATETAVTVADYSFWKAKQGGELTDATEKEISAGAAAMALIVTGILTGNLLLAIPVAAGTGALTEMGQQGVQDRSERKDLDEKFGEE